MLLVALIVVPLIGAVVACLIRSRSINIPFITSAVVLIMGVFGLKGVFAGLPFTYSIPLSGPFAPTFRVDALSAVFVILAAFLWLVVSIYSPDYMKQEGKGKGFDISTLATLSAVLGIFLAGDLFTMLLFFEMMTVASYFWVVHRWNHEAVRAGYFYLFFGIIGGLFLALGMVLMSEAVDFLPAIGSGAVVPFDSQLFVWAIVLFVIGFGIKAGMAPLHVWLPHAHSVAPTPGSALLSGLLIKVGAYGLIRTGEFAGWGVQIENGVEWLGTVLIVLGVITMLVGVVAALLQSNAKRLLAYHSVSQMGYIILGMGIALYMGSGGSLGLMGAIYHIVNHALFKVALFLGVGIIYMHTNEMNLYKLGGLWRRFPVTAALMFLAVLGITGAPGLNGYASKTLLHHAVSQAAESGSSWLIWTERLFSVVGVGTAASFTKLYYLIFLAKPSEIQVSKGVKERFSKPQFAMSILAVVMVGIGFAPKLFPKAAAIPAVQALGMKHAVDALNHVSFWNYSDITGMLITLVLGIVVCWAGLRSGAFHWHPPIWMTLEGLGKLTGQGISAIWRVGMAYYHIVTKIVLNTARTVRCRLHSTNQKFNQSRSGSIGKITLKWVGADAALLIVALTVLIVWYTLINPGLPGQRLPAFLTQWARGILSLGL